MGDSQLPLKIEASACNTLSRVETNNREKKKKNLKGTTFKNSRSWGKTREWKFHGSPTL